MTTCLPVAHDNPIGTLVAARAMLFGGSLSHQGMLPAGVICVDELLYIHCYSRSLCCMAMARGNIARTAL